NMMGILKRTLRDPAIPAERKDPANWPKLMQEEYGSDQGKAAAAIHRQTLVNGLDRIREQLDAFKPDFVLIWGDDQYENFREDVIPPFCVYILDEVDCTPLAGTDMTSMPQNAWGEPADKIFKFKGHPDGAKYLSRRLMEADFDLPYAYATRHHKGLAHSFALTALYLDYDRQGFDFPIVPFHVNCYGSSVIRSRGGGGHLSDGPVAEPDPPGPSPTRCFDIGRATARLLRESPWRVALVGSSSWSHAFLTEKNGWIYPDRDSD